MRCEVFLSLASFASASPLLSLKTPTPVEKFGSHVLADDQCQISDRADARKAAHYLYSGISNGSISGSAIAPAASKVFLGAQPTSTPTSIPDARARVAAQLGLQAGVTANTTESGETSEDFLTNVLGLLLNGIAPSDIAAVLGGASSAENSFNNTGNPDPPAGSRTIYPKAGPSDAPYSLPEAQLRGGVYLPPTFTYGAKFPVLLSHGTGGEAGLTYGSNLGKLLLADGRFDPVYVNDPGADLGDIAVNAEFVAYAINYITALTNQSTAIIGWSQGGPKIQWAQKYWPSTREVLTDSINLSSDYRGSVLVLLLCNGVTNELACTPGFEQQLYVSNFFKKLAETDGDSAYVPTTTVYSMYDEIVQPQEGTGASGYIKDVRGVGVSNNFLQDICAGEPAGGIYTHEGVLYNPATFALVLDALTHDGPASFERVGKAPCQDIVAPGISLADVIETEATIPVALFNGIVYPEKVFVEPPLPAYATF